MFVGEGYTRLYNPEGYQCCVGQFSEQAGVPKEQLLNVSNPAKLVERGYVIKTLTTFIFDNNELTVDAVKINDERGIHFKHRAVALQTLFAKHGIEIVLKNFPE